MGEVVTSVKSPIHVLTYLPVLAAAGGPTPVARDHAVRVARAGADGILLLPPYLVTAPQQGLVRYVEEVTAVTDLPVIFFGLALSMHSNSHLGISLAAMTHVAAAIPNLDHSCDTHYPWNFADDVIVPGVLELRDGHVEVPTGPGLGVELDHDALNRLHHLYVDSGVRSRDDTGYMQRFDPSYELRLPRW
ncbi:hypothetical protein QF037_008584 [Streptomyces canus]|nr:hypothetical protein [Streptomyces canus]